MKNILAMFAIIIFAASCSAQGTITLDEKDAPVRTVLEQVFKQSKKQYVIDNQVAGVITMSISEQSFENTLKLIMRASSIPLTYTIENNIYLVKVRQISQPPANPVIVKEIIEKNSNIVFERIPLTFIDPLDLQILFGPILNIRQFSRFGFNGGFNNGLGNMGNGMNGGFNGMRNF